MVELRQVRILVDGSNQTMDGSGSVKVAKAEGVAGSTPRVGILDVALLGKRDKCEKQVGPKQGGRGSQGFGCD
jgi:hypothetical protein